MLSLVEESNFMLIKINLNKALQRLNFWEFARGQKERLNRQ